MTVSLGGIALSDSLILDGLENAQRIAYSSRRTLGGRMIVQTGPKFVGGRTLTLKAENHFTLDQINAVADIITLGTAVMLIHHRGSFQVRVTAIDVAPTIAYSDPSGTDWYSGAITMIEV